MATFSIESNGRLEKTAIYYNGEQIGGVKEIFLNLDEEGTFDAVIQYEGTDKQIYTKSIFEEYLENLRVVPPSFSEDEAEDLQMITIESNGDIESTTVLNKYDEVYEGIVSLFIHIKGTESPGGIRSIFSKKSVPEAAEFVADVTFRYEDDSIETERVFL
jgi:hypothetical protein